MDYIPCGYKRTHHLIQTKSKALFLKIKDSIFLAQPPGFQGASSVYDMLVQKSRVTSEVNLLVVKPGQPISMSRLDKLVYFVEGR